jgi:hypothetical protein
MRRVCSKCYIEKPLTDEFFGYTNKHRVTLQTECRLCKKAYINKWILNKKLSQDPERDRMKEMYTMKEYTEEEKQERIKKAYDEIHMQAFNKPITQEELERLTD